MRDGINVLSLCDGMSCGQIALNELGIKINNYYASEIDKVAIKVTNDNFPNTIQIGDVINITRDFAFLCSLPKIDLVIFGSPCRSLSRATAGRAEYNNGLDGVSSLFYSCNAILQWVKNNNNKNVYFMIENVDSNKKSDIDKMSDMLGVNPILIDSSLFSAQNRKRNYWTNIPMEPPSNTCNLVLRDILETEVDEKYFYSQEYTYHNDGDSNSVCATLHINGHDILKRISNINYKSPTLTACRGVNKQKKIIDNGKCRKLTPNEYRKLQTIPDWYIMNVADSHIYNMCGDGWTVGVISYIFSFLPYSKNNS